MDNKLTDLPLTKSEINELIADYIIENLRIELKSGGGDSYYNSPFIDVIVSLGETRICQSSCGVPTSNDDGHY